MIFFSNPKNPEKVKSRGVHAGLGTVYLTFSIPFLVEIFKRKENSAGCNLFKKQSGRTPRCMDLSANRYSKWQLLFVLFQRN